MKRWPPVGVSWASKPWLPMQSQMLVAFSILVGATVSSPVVAATYQDPTFGFTFEIPDGYTLHRRDYAQGTTLVLERGDALCLIDYSSDHDLPKSQARVNILAKPLIADLFRKNGVEGPITPFDIGGVEGIMGESSVETSGRPKAREIVVFLETTKGHAHFSCFDTEKTFAAAKPTFERLFRSVRLP